MAEYSEQNRTASTKSPGGTTKTGAKPTDTEPTRMQEQGRDVQLKRTGADLASPK